jgi:glycosyltransferase involved in cell wall biosynthesis
VGDAALLCDPTDELALEDTLKRIANDVDLQHALHKRGLKQAAKFSWERTAQETLAVYKRVLSEYRV